MHPESESATPEPTQVNASQECLSQTANATTGANNFEGLTSSTGLLDHAEPQGSPALQNLLDSGPTLALQPSKSCEVPTVINIKPVSEALQVRKARRHGRVARLPKLPRDMVGRMLSNGVPYKNIVGALDELGPVVTERNISNWVTGGGYHEWQFEQDFALANRLDQDHLVDHLRRDDASELPEVGLQAAATRLSQVLVKKTGEDLEANLDKYSKMVDVLCRLNKEIGILQKQRDDARRSLGRAHDPVRIKDLEEFSTNDHERFYSDPPPESELEKPAEPPALPPEPTSEFLARQDAEDAADKRERNHQEFLAVLKGLNSKNGSSTSTPPKPSPSGAPGASNGHVR